MSRKTNPNKIPRSQADVDRARKQGYDEGIHGALTIMLYTLKDKHGATDEELAEFGRNFNYTLDSIQKGYVKERDLQSVIREDYGLELVIDD